MNQLFLNLQELVDVNSKLCISLQDGLEQCLHREDKDYMQLAVGELFLNSVDIFEAYELFLFETTRVVKITEHFTKKICIVEDISQCVEKRK